MGVEEIQARFQEGVEAASAKLKAGDDDKPRAKVTLADMKAAAAGKSSGHDEKPDTDDDTDGANVCPTCFGTLD